MIYLYTGLPGASKTLNMIKDVFEDPTFQGRPVFYYNINECTVDDWIELTKDQALKWYELPEGSVILFDEGQKLWRPTSSTASVPTTIERMEDHRHQGFDLLITCQNPSQINKGVRNLVGKHINFDRGFGLNSARRIEYQEVQLEPLKESTRKTGIVSRVTLDKKYFDKYKSADVHTHTRKIPKMFYYIFVFLFIGFLLLWYVYDSFSSKATTPKPVESNDSKPSSSYPKLPSDTRLDLSTVTLSDYQRLHTPIVYGLPHTAPFYSDLTEQPKSMPVPDGCLEIKFSDGSIICKCNTEQGTVIDMDNKLCSSIVASGGYYNPYKQTEPYDPNYSYNIGLTASAPSQTSSQSTKRPLSRDN